MENTNDFIFCTLCDYFVRKERKDNFDRHMKIHYGTSITCACGKKLSSNSLSRHQKNSCHLAKGKQSKKATPVSTKKEKKKIKCECGAIVAKSGLARHKTSATHNNGLALETSRLSDGNSLGTNDHLEHVEHRIVTTNVKIITQKDGSKVIEPERITIEGICMMLMPCEQTIESNTFEQLTPAASPVEETFMNESKNCIDFTIVFVCRFGVLNMELKQK